MLGGKFRIAIRIKERVLAMSVEGVYNIKEILKRVVKSLDSKINMAVKLNTKKETEYKKEDFFVNKKISSGFPVSKDSYYNYTAFVNADTPAKEIGGISLKTLYNICIYTDVSADYLLGFITSERKEESAEMAKKEFGLTDEAMKRLAKTSGKKAQHPGELSSDVINLILTNDYFWNALDSLLPTYFAEKYLNEPADYLSRVKFELNEAFIQLADDVCKSLLIEAANAEMKGLSIFGDSKNKGKSFKSIIEECKKRDWIILEAGATSE